MFVIPCNYGNETIALIQYAFDEGLKDVHCITVDTGFGWHQWNDHIKAAEKWVRELGFEAVTLKPKTDYINLMEEQGKFPTTQFQWCASFLKALPMLEYLDFDLDPEYQATILLARRKTSSRANFNLEQKLEGTEHYNGRLIEHPLLEYSEEQRNALIQKTPFEISPTRALECAVCTNFVQADMDWLKAQNTPEAEKMLEAIQVLEARIGTFERSQYTQGFGCGDPYGCGQ